MNASSSTALQRRLLARACFRISLRVARGRAVHRARANLDLAADRYLESASESRPWCGTAAGAAPWTAARSGASPGRAGRTCAAAAPVPSPPPEVAPPVAGLATPVVPPLALPVSAEPLAGFSDGNAFLRSPDNDFILFPNGRLQVDTYLFHYSGDKNKAKIPNNSFLLRRARLELGGWIGSFVYFWLAGDFALGPPASAAPVAPCEPRHHRRLRGAGALEQPGDLAGRSVRRPVHAGEPDLGQVLRLHGTFDHRARLRHPRQQGDGGDAATDSTTTGTTTTRWRC